jgi:ATP-binding cassette, subfamily B, bacterial
MRLSENRLLGLWRMMTDYRFRTLRDSRAAISALGENLRVFTAALLCGRCAHAGENARHDDDPNLPLDRSGIHPAGILVEGGGAFLSGRLAAYTAEGITRRLRDFLFDHIQRLSFSYHSATPTGDLIERVTSDVDALRRFFQNKPSAWDASSCCLSSTGSRSCIST